MGRFFRLNIKLMFFFSLISVVYSQPKPVKGEWDGNFLYIGEGSCINPIGVVFKSTNQIEQGRLLKIVFETGKDIKRLQLFLVSSKVLKNYDLKSLKQYCNVNIKPGFLLRARGFKIDKKIWMVLLGIPSFFAVGNYKLVIAGEMTGGDFFYISGLKVLRRHFKFEKLFLNKELTALKESKNPLIFEQTRILIRILEKFDRKKLFNIKKFSLPVEAVRISSPFGERREYKYLDGKRERRIHNGIDFAVPVGTPVKACGDGEVVFSGERIITGGSIVLEHMPGVYSIYYHLSKLLVKRGDIVKRGKIIGFSGMSGFATGPHLHWEVRVSGVAVDPECFLKQNIIDKSFFIDNINKPVKCKIISEGR